MKVGFIGLGAMGSGMALNLLTAGCELFVYDVRAASMAPLQKAGAKITTSVGELGRNVEVVFTSLPGPTEVKATADELLETLGKNSAWFDVTTNSPAVVKEVAQLCKQKDVKFLDAPVSGGPAGANAGKLAIYVGGDTDEFERCHHLLSAMGNQVSHVGPVGAGNTVKLVHNFVSLVVRMVLVEGMTVGVKAGLDPMDLWHAVRQGVIGRTRTFDLLGDTYLQSNYEVPGMTLRLAHKDFSLAVDLAKEIGVPVKLAEAAYEDYCAALSRGWGEMDSRVAMSLQNERAGVNIKVTAEDIESTLARE